MLPVTHKNGLPVLGIAPLPQSTSAATSIGFGFPAGQPPQLVVSPPPAYITQYTSTAKIRLTGLYALFQFWSDLIYVVVLAKGLKL